METLDTKSSSVHGIHTVELGEPLRPFMQDRKSTEFTLKLQENIYFLKVKPRPPDPYA